MKTKLTLRLDSEVKKRAKALAARRGTSVSKLVEDYFRLLVQEEGELSKSGREGEAEQRNESGSLPPRTKALQARLGQPIEPPEMDADTAAWVDAATEKHA